MKRPDINNACINISVSIKRRKQCCGDDGLRDNNMVICTGINRRWHDFALSFENYSIYVKLTRVLSLRKPMSCGARAAVARIVSSMQYHLIRRRPRYSCMLHSIIVTLTTTCLGSLTSIFDVVKAANKGKA